MTKANWTGGYDPREETYDSACEILRTISYRSLQYNRVDARRGDDTSWRVWIPNMLGLIGYSVADIDRLKVIQITATKGKGSTAAFTAALLQQMGGTPSTQLKIGRFTTPALFTARDQIAINGTPVSERLFTTHFFKIWNRIRSTEDLRDPYSYGKPRAFYILYVLAVSLFLEERVDAAVFEVFAGGWNDCTNIVRNSLVSSVGNVGLDHVGSLGNTEEKIAKEKAGVYKANGHAVTVLQKRTTIDNILRNAAYRQKCRSFTVVHRIQALESVPLGINGHMQHLNAALAMTLVAAFVDHPRCPVVFRRLQTSLPPPKAVSEANYVFAKWEDFRLATDYPFPTCTVLVLSILIVFASQPPFGFPSHTVSSLGFTILPPLLSACIALYARQRRTGPPLPPPTRDRLPTINVPQDLLKDPKILRALQETTLPGRGEVVQDVTVPSLRWILDCAHTPCSMPNASAWARTVFDQRPGVQRVLLFSIEPYRPAREMFHNMLNAMRKADEDQPPFDRIIFINDIFRKDDYQNDPSLSELDRLEKYWRSVCCSRHPTQLCPISKLATVEEGVEEVYGFSRKTGAGQTDCFALSCWPGDIYSLTKMPVRYSVACVLKTSSQV